MMWDKTKSDEVQKVGWRWLTTKWFRDPDGNEQEFVTTGRLGGRSVAVIALTPEYGVVIARQVRPGPEMVLDELPGGGVDDGEDIEVAARRELHEETGYTPGRIEYLGQAHKDAYSNTTSHFFLAYDCVRDGEPHPDEGEYIDVREITIDQLRENAMQGNMTDAIAVLLAHDQLKQIRKG